MDLIEHRVRERAYYIWEDEGRVHGRADAHWLRAESEIAAPAPILAVRPVAEASRAPSPAGTLKPKGPATKAARSRAVVEAEPAKAAPRTAAGRSAAAKGAAAKNADKTAAAETAAPRVAVPKAPKALVAAGAKAKAARNAASAGLH